MYTRQARECGARGWYEELRFTDSFAGRAGRRFQFTSAAVALIAFTAPALAGDCVQPKASATDGARFRDAPVADGASLGTLTVGQTAPLVASIPRWYETKMPSGQAAFIIVVSSGPTRYATVTLPDAEIIAEFEGRGEKFRTDIEDADCMLSDDKIGPDGDGKAGGCDNVPIKLPMSGAIIAEYRRVAD